ncbi:MAG TPA: fumarylacetoacetate hydrolase family protein [Devosiaceae bacterium]|jgi:2-keto-4-pentenoate hydratase/2-oxohepta-3-ene-1,7-dioic acid hydratase in catechol pathway
MKLAVYDLNRIALVEGDMLYDVTDVMPSAGDTWPPTQMTRLIADWEALQPRLIEHRRNAQPIPRHTVTLRSPQPLPFNVVAAPANYRKHVGELGNRAVVPVGKSARDVGFFLKSGSSVVGADEAILLPPHSKRRYDHECELAVIIGKRAKTVSRDDAMSHVFGYSCLIDATMRLDPDRVPEERVMRKSFDTFTPLGPYIVTADEVADPHALTTGLWVNGIQKQSANTRDLIVDIPGLIEMISSVMTLYPGDVIATGTPEGVGPIEPGDQVRIAIESVGDMTIAVRTDENRPPQPFE